MDLILFYSMYDKTKNTGDLVGDGNDHWDGRNKYHRPIDCDWNFCNHWRHLVVCNHNRADDHLKCQARQGWRYEGVNASAKSLNWINNFSLRGM
jgi:hypothetical protein